MSRPRVQVAVLASGSGSNLQALIDACAAPTHPAQIALVVSDRRHAGALDRARAANVPHVWIGRRRRSRDVHEAEILAALRETGVEWLALAGYMRLIGATLLDAYPDRILNIHPALLPAFPGLDAQGQAHAAGVRVAGATVHLVDAGTDTGPIVAQAAVPVLPGDTRDDLQRRILGVEHQLFPRALRWAAEGRLRVCDGQVLIDLPSGEQAFIWGG